MFTCCKSLPLKAELPVNHLFFFFFLYVQHQAWLLGKNRLQSLLPGDMGTLMMLRAHMKSWAITRKVGPASRSDTKSRDDAEFKSRRYTSPETSESGRQSAQ